MSVRTLSPEEGWIWRSYIGWRGKPLPSRHVLKNFEGKPERENPKKTISASGGLGAVRAY